jgi:solute:Na+ symporter, SSS family
VSYLSIDYLIVYGFLAITLVVGFWAGRGIKDIREYAIANKMYGTGVLTMAILATYITGSKGIGFIGQVFDDGIIPLLPVLVCGVVCCFGFITLFIVPRMKHFQGCLTAAELMGEVYGQRARYVIAILGVFYSLTLVGKQIAWLGTLGGLIDTPNKVVILVVGGCLLVYAAQGGIKSVTATDIIHFVAITSIIPLVAYFLLYKVGGAKALFSSLPSNYLDVVHHPDIKGYLFHSIWYLFPAFPLSFPFIQHMLMARDTKNLIASYQIVTIFLVIFFLLLALIGLSAVVIRRDIDGNMPADGGRVFIYMIKHYFSIPFRGFMVVGLFAGVMSTADSFLHTSGLLLTHDFIQPFCKRMNYLIPEHKVIKVVTVLLGAIVLWGACSNLDLPLYVNGLSLSKALNIITTPVALVFTVPLIAAIMGLKGDEGSFFIAFFSTVIVFVLSYVYLPTQLVIPMGVATNILTFFGAHYVRHKRFVTVRHLLDEQMVADGVSSRKSVGISFIKMLATLGKALIRSRTKPVRHGSEPELFALWLLFNYMVPIFMHSYSDLVAYNWLLSIRSLGALLCVGLLLKSYWPRQLLTYFSVYYHLSLLYCLPFVTTFLFLLEGGNVEWVVNVTLSIMLLIVLVDWVSFIVLSIGGVLLGLVSYYLLVDGIPLTLSTNISYMLVYSCLFSTLIGLIFARKKQLSFDKLSTDNQALLVTELVNRERLLESFREKVRIIQTLKHAGIQNLLQVARLLKDLRAREPSSPLSMVTPPH